MEKLAKKLYKLSTTNYLRDQFKNHFTRRSLLCSLYEQYNLLCMYSNSSWNFADFSVLKPRNFMFVYMWEFSRAFFTLQYAAFSVGMLHAGKRLWIFIHFRTHAFLCSFCRGKGEDRDSRACQGFRLLEVSLRNPKTFIWISFLWLFPYQNKGIE